MTCIVGLRENGKVYIGGDSAGVNGALDLQVRADSKVWSKEGWVFGFTTSFRMGQLLRYSFHPPRPRSGDDVMAYMVTDFIEAVRTTLKNGGFAKKKEDEETGGTFLVGFQGRLFQVESDYQVAEQTENYDAVGCGAAYAKGALYASEGQPVSEDSIGIVANIIGREAARFIESSPPPMLLDKEQNPERRVRLALEAAARYSAGVRGPFTIVSA